MRGLLTARDPSPLWFTSGLDCGQVSNFPSPSCFRHKHTKAVILTAVKRLRLPKPRRSPALSPCRARHGDQAREQAIEPGNTGWPMRGLLTARDPSPLWFTHGLDCGQVANFPSPSCFRHKHTKAVILTAVKRLRQLHAGVFPSALENPPQRIATVRMRYAESSFSTALRTPCCTAGSPK